MTLGKDFDQPLPSELPCLQQLILGEEFNQPLQHLALPSLERLVLGATERSALGQCPKLRCLTFSGASKRSFKEVGEETCWAKDSDLRS